MCIRHPIVAYRHFQAPLLCLTYAYILLYIKLVLYRPFNSRGASVHIPGYLYYSICIPMNVLCISMPVAQIL